MSMSFATLTQPIAEELGKAGTDTLASRWKGMLEVGSVNCQVYAVDPGKILFVSSAPGQTVAIRNFVLSQPEVDWFEKDQKRYYPEGRHEPLMDNDARKQREIELGWKQPDPTTTLPPRARRRRRSKTKEL